MNTYTLVMLLIIGLSAGIFSGLVGLGGGIIIVPALVIILGMSQYTAQGTTLAMMILPVGILAVINYYRKDYVDVPAALFLAGSFIIGGYLGSRTALILSPEIVRRILGIFIILAGLKMIFGK